MTPDSLPRLAASLDACSRALNGVGEPPAPEAERVSGLLRSVAADLARHAAELRRLDDEIDLLSRRRDDGRALADRRRRRQRAQARVHSALDEATRALLPGGDRLEPGTILRRFGVTSPRRYGYFGRPPVDRGHRLLRLTTHLLRGSAPTRIPRPVPRPTAVTLPSRETRLARIRQRFRAHATSRHTAGVVS